MSRQFSQVPFSRWSSRAGFTLAEVLVASSLVMLVSAAIFSSFLFVARSSMGLVNYSEMNSESRHGLDTFGRDIRSARSIKAGFSENAFTVRLPDNSEITYAYVTQGGKGFLMRTPGTGEPVVIMRQVEPMVTDDFEGFFRYYNLQGGSAANTLEVKQIQLQLKLVRKTVAQEQTERVVSARFILRNKEVSN
jgi:hypothetical protein